MSVSTGLTGVALPDLRELLSLVEQGRLACPLTRTTLMAVGLGHVAEEMAVVQGLDRDSVLSVLRVAITERELRPVPHLELVWTGPEARVSHARDTAVVVRQLFEEARESVLIAGFRFDHGEEIFRPLHAAMKDRGVEALLFLDIEGRAPTDSESTAYAEAAIGRFFERNWPFGDPRPTVFYDPRTVSPLSQASLHAKCIIVDNQKTLVTSANFTERGQTRNIEAGVLILDPGFATRLAAQWRGLIASGLVNRSSLHMNGNP